FDETPSYRDIEDHWQRAFARWCRSPKQRLQVAQGNTTGGSAPPAAKSGPFSASPVVPLPKGEAPPASSYPSGSGIDSTHLPDQRSPGQTRSEPAVAGSLRL